MAFKAAGGDVEAWLDWCASGSNYGGEREARAVWRSFKSTGPVSPATLFRAAIDAGWSQGETPRRAPQRSVREAEPELILRTTLDPRWLSYWQSLGEVRAVGRQYLEARQCVLPPKGGALRFDPAGRHPSGYRGPCLVAMVTHAVDDTPISLHRTWVNADGTKTNLDPSRLLLGGHRKAGGVIRLWPDEAVMTGLGIAEGIESALSLAHAIKPVWSCIDAGNLAKFPVLPGIESLTIAVDDDPSGIGAANECAERWAQEDRDVSLVEVPHGA